MIRQGWMAAMVLALGLVAGCGDAGLGKIARASEARLGDPRAVVAATCTESSSPMCGCIVEETVKTLQAGPRELLALFESPTAVWNDVVKNLDSAERARAQQMRMAAEATCRHRMRNRPQDNLAIHRPKKPGEEEKRSLQTIRGSCASEGNPREVCDCYEQTLKDALSVEAYSGLRTDAKFPPPLEALPPKTRRVALATIASARSVCGLR